MKTSMFTILPLALAAGVMAANSNEGNKGSNKNITGNSEEGNANDLLKVEGNQLVEIDAQGNLLVVAFATLLPTATEADRAAVRAAPAKWKTMCTAAIESALPGLLESGTAPIQGMSPVEQPDHSIAHVCHCGGAFTDDKTDVKKILWLTGSLIQDLGWEGHIIKSMQSTGPAPSTPQDKGAQGKGHKGNDNEGEKDEEKRGKGKAEAN